MVNYEHKFKDFFGVGLSYISMYNSVDCDAMEDYFQSQYPSLFWNVNSDGYSQYGLMYGALFHLPMGKHLLFNSKVFVGLDYAKSPHLSIYDEDANGNYAILTYYETHKLTSIINLGVGLEMKVTNTLSFSLNYDFILTKPKFTTSEELLYTDGTSDYSNITFNQKMNSLMVTWGISRSF